MTEPEREDEISRRYRELAREEPPHALDEAILAAARRELETRPAPLVAPSGRRRWAVPIAAAAVIVLSAVVTLHVQREQPDEELATPPPAVQKDEKAAVAARAEVQQERAAREERKATASGDQKREDVGPAPERRKAPAAVRPAPAPFKPVAPLEGEARSKPGDQPRGFAADPQPAAAPAASAPQMQMTPAEPAAKPGVRGSEAAGTASGGAPVAAERRAMAESARDSMRQREQFGALAKRADVSEPPERILERIATLRREGRSKEADDLYAEFRRRFPDYRIPESMRERVVPR